MTGASSDPALSEASIQHRDELVIAAREARLHEDPYWLLLGHYRPRWIDGQKSMIDDPAFFLAADGKYDPAAELEATLRGLFDAPPLNPDERHPVCRFPARYAWLRDRLPIRNELLPVPECEIYQQVYNELKPSTLTLVFPAAYMNSPASMFGHTLLVFDSADQNRLLAKGVGYAAAVTTGFGPLFALEGILGMYPGRYAVENYYDKVETYNDIHRRDIWEYELDLTQEEVDRVFRHTWELQNIWSWYYFFDENCAYKLYQLIDVARPGLALSDDPSWFVIPIDTVKFIYSRDLVRKTEFRPSKATRLIQIHDHLDEPVARRALSIARGREEPALIASDESISLGDRRLALDLSADYAQYLYTEKILPKDEYAVRFIGILRERSKLGPRDEQDFAIAPPAPPEDGHAAAMIAPGAGIENEHGFLSLRGRVAYHGLLDNDDGFTRGAQIMFLNSEGRWYEEEDRFELRFADVVHVESIAPRTDLFLPVSWRARIGFTQLDRRELEDSMVFSIQTGGGAAWELGRSHLVWTMLESEIHIADRYEDYGAIGPGASVNWMASPSENLKALVQARTAWMYDGDDWWRGEAGAGLDWRYDRERSLRLNYLFTMNDDYDINEAGLSWNLFF